MFAVAVHQLSSRRRKSDCPKRTVNRERRPAVAKDRAHDEGERDEAPRVEREFDAVCETEAPRRHRHEQPCRGRRLIGEKCS